MGSLLYIIIIIGPSTIEHVHRHATYDNTVAMWAGRASNHEFTILIWWSPIYITLIGTFHSYTFMFVMIM